MGTENTALDAPRDIASDEPVGEHACGGNEMKMKESWWNSELYMGRDFTL